MGAAGETLRLFAKEYRMDNVLRSHGDAIVNSAIEEVQPDAAVARALAGKAFPGRVLLVAAGKAAWQMAKAAYDCIGNRIETGIIITKYNHVKGPVANFACYEAGHPVPDENTFNATQKALELVSDLTEKDTVLFLLSGGGSALFEKPLVAGEELQDITTQRVFASTSGIKNRTPCITRQAATENAKPMIAIFSTSLRFSLLKEKL